MEDPASPERRLGAGRYKTDSRSGMGSIASGGWRSNTRREVAKVTGGREENREERWQKRFTQVLQQFIVDEHKTKMKSGGREEDLEIAPSDQEIPSGWPPLQATQHRHPRYSVQSGLAVKIGIDDIRTMKKSCPFCGKALTSQHSLVCVKANQNMIISRHNTTTKTIGTHIASTGIMAEYEKKLPAYSTKTTHPRHDMHQRHRATPHRRCDMPAIQGNRDMRQATARSKTYKYMETWGKMFENIHFVMLDNRGCKRMPERSGDQHRDEDNAGCDSEVNEICWEVMRRRAEETNRIHSAKSKSMLLPLD